MPRWKIISWKNHMKRKLIQPRVSSPTKLAVGQRRGRGDEEQDDRRHRLGGEVGLHAVPDDADDAADHRGEVGAHHPERDAGHHRERDARRGATAGRSGSSARRRSGCRSPSQAAPASRSGRTGTGWRRRCSRRRVDVRHPHREDRVAGPGALLHRHRGEVLVVEVAGRRRSCRASVRVRGDRRRWLPTCPFPPGPVAVAAYRHSA